MQRWKAAGIRAVRFHDLRHSFGTRMAAAGAPLRAIQEWMGHCDYATTLIYADDDTGPVPRGRCGRSVPLALSGIHQLKDYG